MKRAFTLATIALSGVVALLLATTANAQDGFSQSGRVQQQDRTQLPPPADSYAVPPAQPDPWSEPPTSPPPGNGGPISGTSPGSANEMQDFGVAATGQLRPTHQLHAPTPTSIPGGQVIGTQQLAQLLQRGGNGLLLLDVYGGPQHLPGAMSAGPAAQGGSFNDPVQQEFGQFLQQTLGGDTSRMIVVYCGGVQCWSSYNAALRAIHLGYRNVAWYRGGIEAWQQAGLPMQPTPGFGNGASR